MDNVSPQARRRLHRGVLAAAIFLTVAPAALADPPGGAFTAAQEAAPRQPAAETAITAAQPPSSNAPDPGASFLASAPHSYWRRLDRIGRPTVP